MGRFARPQPLGELIAGLPISSAHSESEIDGLFITDVTEDSRRVEPGSLFIARRGERFDATQFIPQAISAGASAVMVERDTPIAGEIRAAIEANHAIVLVLADDLSRATAVVAERFFGRPSSRLKLIGITGTNGKTTTAHLIHQLLNAAGMRCGMLGTVSIDDGSGLQPAELTTPFAIDVSRTLARMVANGCRAAVMEVSSHALAQGRTSGLSFTATIFTNLSGDHLDYHGTMDAYADAKAKLFESLDEDAWAILNADDVQSERMKRECRARVIETTLSESARVDQWRMQVGSLSPGGMHLTWRAPGESSAIVESQVHLVGRHNAMNLLQAIAAVAALNVPVNQISSRISECKAPPGRLEPVIDPSGELTVLVDYAHTDDALRNVLTAVRPIVPEGARLIVVFGCGGDRDRTKRPRMARVACELADVVIITSDNPRTEDPETIVNEILAGAPESCADRAAIQMVTEIDRARAIRRTIHELARRRDIIVIAGKGHEDYQIVGSVKRPFDDRTIAREALERRCSNTNLKNIA